MATQLDIFTTLLDKIHMLSTATNNPDELSNLINQLQSVTSMIRNGYQFSSADLMDLPTTLQSLITDMYATDSASWDSSIQASLSSLTSSVNTSLSAFEARHNPIRSSVGDTTVNIHTGFTTVAGSSYYHLKTPLKANFHNSMYHFRLRGYDYTNGSLIDNTFVGYCYAGLGNIIKGSSSGGNTPLAYVSSDGFVCFRISVASSFCTVVADFTKVGNGIDLDSSSGFSSHFNNILTM